MSVIFSGKEVLEIAIQIEKNGFTFYSQAAHKVTDNKARELIEWLAQEEKSHVTGLKIFFLLSALKNSI